MNQYIVNLTSHLISKNRYDEIFRRTQNDREFIQHVTLDLETNDVLRMSPGKLGEIMCSFDIGDVMASKMELFQEICFSGDCENMLRELVSVCLAYAIKDRLDDNGLPTTPRWRRKEDRRNESKIGTERVLRELSRKFNLPRR